MAVQDKSAHACGEVYGSSSFANEKPTYRMHIMCTADYHRLTRRRCAVKQPRRIIIYTRDNHFRLGKADRNGEVIDFQCTTLSCS